MGCRAMRDRQHRVMRSSSQSRRVLVVKTGQRLFRRMSQIRSGPRGHTRFRPTGARPDDHRRPLGPGRTRRLPPAGRTGLAGRPRCPTDKWFPPLTTKVMTDVWEGPHRLHSPCSARFWRRVRRSPGPAGLSNPGGWRGLMGVFRYKLGHSGRPARGIQSPRCVGQDARSPHLERW